MVVMTKVPAFNSSSVNRWSGWWLPGSNPMITGGFGGTLSSIGLGFGCQKFSEVTGAAERMARVFTKMFGKGEDYSTYGFIV